MRTVALQFAFRLGLLTFGVVALRGALRSIDFTGGMQDALLASVVFFSLGFVLGEIARRLVEEHVQAEQRRVLSRDNHTSH